MHDTCVRHYSVKTCSITFILFVALVREFETLKIKDKVNNVCCLNLAALNVVFCRDLLAFTTDVLGFYVPQLYEVFVESLGGVFHHVVKLHLDAVQSGKHPRDVEFIQSNSVFLVDTVLIAIGKKVKDKLGFDAEEITKLRDQLRSGLNVDDGDV